MLVIGLIGGIASGKSAVAKELSVLGATVLDADAAAHRVINRSSVRSALVDRWGASILDEVGQVDRRAVAKRVFSADLGRSELKFLEGLLHPLIRQEFETEIASLSQTPTPAVVIDAPLLLEAGWGELCDVLLFVDSPLADRQSRAENLRNWSPNELATREAVQLPIEEKRHQATHFVSNEGSLESLTAQVRQFWQQLPQT
ncbi:dephospho-CoA kinase [Bythopirellula polymerisocia]|uniref:Dephospho-CoA kinase n=1 Tax=Bythopirellula polymerisocia TaxID=2528003 RepID=A0A5C6CTZ8_9BACT|nr:dephospho-CoA kinase [Bythopirellula polymerisocia]TWU27335.1 Dephospho-CoA kinase [Bythopirellula polymerisocia]